MTDRTLDGLLYRTCHKYGLFKNRFGPLAGIGAADHFSLRIAAANLFSLGARAHMEGGASDSHRTACVRRGLGEAFERYASCFIPKTAFLRGKTFNDLPGDKCQSPEVYSLYHESQYSEPGFPYAEFTRDLKQDWLAAVEPESGEPHWLPASALVFLEPSAVKIQAVTSSGAGAGPSPAAAALSGLLEIVERDAICLYWRNRFPGLLIPPEELFDFEEYRGAAEVLRSRSENLYVLWLNTDIGIPVIACLYFGSGERGDWPIALSAAASLDKRVALRRSLNELVQIVSFSAGLYSDSKCKFISSPDEVVDFEHHLQYFSSPDRAGLCRFLTEGDRIRWRDIPEIAKGETSEKSLQLASHCIKNAGYRTYVLDMTTRDVALLGYRVARVYVPGLMQMEADHRARFIGGSRILSFGRTMKLCGNIRTVADLNHEPHPFA